MSRRNLKQWDLIGSTSKINILRKRKGGKRRNTNIYENGQLQKKLRMRKQEFGRKTSWDYKEVSVSRSDPACSRRTQLLDMPVGFGT